LLQTAYCSSSVQSFVAETPQSVIGILAQHHPHDPDVLQRNSWLAQIEILQHELSALEGGWVAFELPFREWGNVLTTSYSTAASFFVLEFKVGADQVTASAIDQATDYALDLKNFHAGSHELPIVPVVIATNAPARQSQLAWSTDDVAIALSSNGVALGALIKTIARDRGTRINVDPAI
jgi:hypothetical protein